MLGFEVQGGWRDVKSSVVVTTLQYLMGGGGSFSAGGPGIPSLVPWGLPLGSPQAPITDAVVSLCSLFLSGVLFCSHHLITACVPAKALYLQTYKTSAQRQVPAATAQYS